MKKTGRRASVLPAAAIIKDNVNIISCRQIFKKHNLILDKIRKIFIFSLTLTKKIVSPLDNIKKFHIFGSKCILNKIAFKTNNNSNLKNGGYYG